MRLDIADLTAEIGSKRVVAEPHRFIGPIGPNGSGKSTLLRTVYRALRPTGGIVSLDGRNLWRMPARQAIRQRAVVPQHDDRRHSIRCGNGRFPTRSTNSLGLSKEEGARPLPQLGRESVQPTTPDGRVSILMPADRPN
ncbi:ATP-binding cassette domain-containing protein [Actinomadura rugatobispora]|uniref:ATP-binding cassette domain-containing protein n=1 Tax=Actinomadura rugatobispora TaxID=1994 RepID=A0ABW0ZUD9_9ACTN